jgi:hypothetical protein
MPAGTVPRDGALQAVLRVEWPTGLALKGLAKHKDASPHVVVDTPRRSPRRIADKPLELYTLPGSGVSCGQWHCPERVAAPLKLQCQHVERAIGGQHRAQVAFAVVENGWRVVLFAQVGDGQHQPAAIRGIGASQVAFAVVENGWRVVLFAQVGDGQHQPAAIRGIGACGRDHRTAPPKPLLLASKHNGHGGRLQRARALGCGRSWSTARLNRHHIPGPIRLPKWAWDKRRNGGHSLGATARWTTHRPTARRPPSARVEVFPPAGRHGVTDRHPGEHEEPEVEGGGAFHSGASPVPQHTGHFSAWAIITLPSAASC